MSYTVLDLITRAFRIAGIIGVGQSLTADDTTTAMDALNDILAQWQVQRWLVWSEVTTGVTSTGAESYSIGTGGDFNITRPDRIESGFMRFLRASTPVTVDRPLRLIQSREDYNRLRLKNLGSIPEAVFYDNAYPLGNLYFWPVPLAGDYEVFVSTKTILPNFSDLTTTISVPPEYIAAMRYELAVILREEYQMPPSPVLLAAMTKAKTVLRNANAQIPSLGVGRMVPGQNGGWYSPYSDDVTN